MFFNSVIKNDRFYRKSPISALNRAYDLSNFQENYVSTFTKFDGKSPRERSFPESTVKNGISYRKNRVSIWVGTCNFQFSRCISLVTRESVTGQNWHTTQPFGLISIRTYSPRRMHIQYRIERSFIIFWKQKLDNTSAHSKAKVRVDGHCTARIWKCALASIHTHVFVIVFFVDFVVVDSNVVHPSIGGSSSRHRLCVFFGTALNFRN